MVHFCLKNSITTFLEYTVFGGGYCMCIPVPFQAAALSDFNDEDDDDSDIDHPGCVVIYGLCFSLLPQGLKEVTIVDRDEHYYQFPCSICDQSQSVVYDT